MVTGELAGKPIRGNFGLRYVDTEIDSIGFRNELSVVTGIDPDDGSTEFFILPAPSGTPLEQISQSNSYTELLPSVRTVSRTTPRISISTC